MGGQDRTAASVAGRQQGVVTHGQLRECEISARSIEQRLAKGTLIRVYRGVYRLGHVAPSLEADCMAAVLACGNRAVLRGRSAAHLLGLTRRRPPVPEVMTPTERRVEGIETRRTRNLN